MKDFNLTGVVGCGRGKGAGVWVVRLLWKIPTILVIFSFFIIRKYNLPDLDLASQALLGIHDILPS